jgi:2,5-furandicarboxylate decarboxylase 1
MGITGGIRGAPAELVPCETIDMPCVAGAEIVLEAEILPTGWSWPEGRFGEFTRLMGGLHWNPLVRIKAITRRRDAIYYSLHMPWENTWLGASTRYTAIRAALKNAGVQVRDLNVTTGGCAMWHAIISLKKQAGEGKNALLAALSVMDVKHAVVVDDDIDVFNAMDVEWAIATRVQGDRDVFVIPGARAKPLDPSLSIVAHGTVPTGAKVGIDATIGEGIPRERYERISYAYADQVKIQDYVSGKADAVPTTIEASADDISKLAKQIHTMIKITPKYYSEIAESFADCDFRSITRALAQLHVEEKLWQDPRGRMCIRGSEHAAKPPTRTL